MFYILDDFDLRFNKGFNSYEEAINHVEKIETAKYTYAIVEVDEVSVQHNTIKVEHISTDKIPADKWFEENPNVCGQEYDDGEEGDRYAGA